MHKAVLTRVEEFMPSPDDEKAAPRERLMGAILVEAGRLRPQDIEPVLRLQARKGLRFGDAARKLGLLTRADVDLALARQFDHPCPQPGESELSADLVAAYEPFSAPVEALRAVRSELTLRWLEAEPGPKALAILSAARREGRSFVAANLAIVFSQIGYRTILIDADLRHPCQHRLFGLKARSGLSSVLSGRSSAREAVHQIDLLPNLSVLPAGVVPPNPQDLLARPALAELLQMLGKTTDLIVLDCPPVGHGADAQSIAVRAGAALIVVRRNASRMWRVQALSSSVGQAKTTIVGAILNER